MKNLDQIVTVDSGVPGPTVVILAGVHGNEVAGIELVKNYIQTRCLNILKGKMHFAFGNPKAIAGNTRFTEVDLNRQFASTVQNTTTYEYSRAQFLKKLFQSADVLIDLHASFTAQTNPFIICERNAINIIKSMPISTICFGLDAVQPGGTDYYMNQIGKIGICIECGYLDDANGVQVADQCVKSALKALGMTQAETLPMVPQQLFDAYIQYYSKTDCCTLSKQFADFEVVLQGQLLATDGAIEVRAEQDSSILFAHSVKASHKEVFVLLKAVST